MSSDEEDIERRFKPLMAVHSSDQTTINKREIINSEKHLKEKSSKLTDIGQYLEKGKKLRERDSSQRVDRAMEAYQEVYVEQISDGSSQHSEEGTTPRRQPELEHGLGSSSVDPSCVSQTQAAADPSVSAQAFKEAEIIRKDRDSLALDQIVNRGKIMDLEKKIAELSSDLKSKADHSGDSRTRNGSPVSVSDGPKGQRFMLSQSGDNYERVSDESSQLVSGIGKTIGAESGSVNTIPADKDIIAATSGRLIKNIQEAFNVVFSEIKSLRQVNESGVSKDAHAGSKRQSRQVSALSRSSGRGTDQESSHDLERPSSSRNRSNQFLPFDSLEEQNNFLDEQFMEDGVQRDEDIEDDVLDVHPEDEDLYEDDE